LTVHPLPRVTLESSADASGGVDDEHYAARRHAGRLKMLLLLLVSAAPVIASYFMYFVVQPRGEASHGELMVPTLSWPKGSALTDVDGRNVAADANATWRGQWTLVVFGRSSCNTACERRLYTQRQLREMLGRERERIEKVFIVVDDAPLEPKLASALAAQPPTRVLRASGAQVAAWMRAPLDEIESRMVVVDPMGEWMMRTPRDLEPAKFKRDLDRLLRASASWDHGGRP
jgi:SCO1/SenC